MRSSWLTQDLRLALNRGDLFRAFSGRRVAQASGALTSVTQLAR